MKLVSLKKIPVTSTSHAGVGRKQVMVEKGVVPALMQFAQARFAPGEIALEHSHSDMFEVMFVESGRGVMVVDDKEVPLETGSCITVEPGERHELRNTGDEDLVLTYFGIVE